MSSTNHRCVLPPDPAELRIDGHHRGYTPEEVRMLRQAGFGIVPVAAEPTSVVRVCAEAALRRSEIECAMRTAVDFPV